MAVHTVAAERVPETVLSSQPATTATIRMAITDTGYAELQEEGGVCVHYRLVIPPRPPLASDMPHGMTFRCTGSDRWLPLDSVIVDVSRTTRAWPEGWEWRSEICNQKTLDYWWVPSGCMDSFGEFYAELES